MLIVLPDVEALLTLLLLTLSAGPVPFDALPDPAPAPPEAVGSLLLLLLLLLMLILIWPILSVSSIILLLPVGCDGWALPTWKPGGRVILILWANGAASGGAGGTMLGKVKDGWGASESMIAIVRRKRCLIKALAGCCMMADAGVNTFSWKARADVKLVLELDLDG